LHPDIFIKTQQMEAEIILWGVELFHGDAQTVGVTTTGGTESLLMSVLAYRNMAKELRGVTKPNIVVCKSMHCAVDKAGFYFGVEVRRSELDPETFQCDLDSLEELIDSNTIALYGSSPNYPSGIIDDIVGIAKIARKHNLPCHSDACLGGFLLAFMEEAGFKIPPYDFRVPGITSVTADLHKYGYAPKGISLLLYKSGDLRRYQYFVTLNWQGGIYATPTVAGSRAGLIVAATWAVMMYFGKDGYVKKTKDVITAARKIRDEARLIDGIQVMGNPEVSVIAFTTDRWHPYGVSELMHKKGWVLNNINQPLGFHFCVTASNYKNAGLFIKDLRQAIEDLKKDPSLAKSDYAAIYGLASAIPDKKLVGGFVHDILDMFYEA